MDTLIYDEFEINDALIFRELKEIAEILEEKGYNAVNQITGYLISGDLGYISSHKCARNRMAKLDHTQIIEALVRQKL